MDSWALVLQEMVCSNFWTKELALVSDYIFRARVHADEKPLILAIFMNPCYIFALVYLYAFLLVENELSPVRCLVSEVKTTACGADFTVWLSPNEGASILYGLWICF